MKRGSHGGRPPKFGKTDDKQRLAVAPPGRRHEVRRLAVRYEATVLIATINEWL
ncbi:hypothetical protein ACWD0A_17545 [Streptomyces sp. NPDC002867]